MKITYASPNASHHYYYAKYLDQAGYLQAFITGWPRFARKSRGFHLKADIERVDFFQTLYLLQGCDNSLFASLSNYFLDARSYFQAIKSEVFLYYRTCGLNTAIRMKNESLPVISIVEEVNSHVLYSHKLVLEEYQKCGLDPQHFPHPYDVRKRLDAYQISDYILCPSTYVKKSFLGYGFSAEKLIINSYGIPFAASSNQRNIHSSQKTFRILFVGQINIRKGLKYLLQAFENIAYSNKELLLVGPTTSVTGLENAHIPDNVKFTGVLKGDALSCAYSSSTVFVLPSVDEGMALVQGEALSFGLPLIATTNTGAEDLITHGVEGFIVKPCDSMAIQEAIETLIESPQLLEKMSYNARQRSTNLISWAHSTNNLIHQCQELLMKRA